MERKLELTQEELDRIENAKEGEHVMIIEKEMIGDGGLDFVLDGEEGRTFKSKSLWTKMEM